MPSSLVLTYIGQELLWQIERLGAPGRCREVTQWLLGTQMPEQLITLGFHLCPECPEYMEHADALGL